VPGQLTESAVRSAVEKDFPVTATPLPRDGDTLKVGDSELKWHAVDTTNYNVNLYHFAYALNKPTTNVLFWAVTVVNAPREMSGVRLAIGSNAASVWWINGSEATALYNDANGLRVAVADAQNRIHYVPITIERDTGAALWVATGLTGDERIVKIAVPTLADGDLVDVSVAAGSAQKSSP